MNWMGIVNYLLTTGGAFLAGFFSVPLLVDGTTLKAQLVAGVTAGIASAMAHIRDNPFKLS